MDATVHGGVKPGRPGPGIGSLGTTASGGRPASGERKKGAAFGVFICLKTPTKPMNEAALEQGQWVSDYDGRMYPRVQILCAQDLIDGKRPRMPASGTGLFAKPERERTQQGTQGRLT